MSTNTIIEPTDAELLNFRAMRQLRTGREEAELEQLHSIQDEKC